MDGTAEQELLRPRKLLDRRDQPHQELEMGLDGGPRLASVVGHWPIPKKKRDQGYALDQDVKK